MTLEGRPPIPRRSSPIPTSLEGGRDGVQTATDSGSGIPQPTQHSHQPSGELAGDSSSLQDQFQKCKTENALLGQLLQDCQAECTRLKKVQKEDKKNASRQQEANKARVRQLQNGVLLPLA